MHFTIYTLVAHLYNLSTFQLNIPTHFQTRLIHINLYGLTCFPYEDFNSVLKSYVHESNSPQLQIGSAVNNFLYLNEIIDKFIRLDSAAYDFCRKIERSGIRRRVVKKL